MNIVEVEVRAIRPDPKGNNTLGNVTFYVSGGTGDRCDVLNFECRCQPVLVGTPDQRLAYTEQGLKADALRQAKRMPEFRSGEDHLTFLRPLEQHTL